MRGLRTIPVLLDVCRDIEELCPDALLLNTSTRWRCSAGRSAEASRDPHRRAVPLRPAHRRGARRRPRRWRRGSRLPRRRHQPPRVLPAPRARRRGPLPGAARGRRRRTATACATRCSSTSGYFVTESSEHFAEYVPWFIKAGRPGPDRALQHPARRVPAPLRGQIAEWEALRGRARGRRSGRRPRAAIEYGADIIRACETGEPFALQRQRPQPLRRRAADRQPARRLLRRGAVRGLGARDRAAAPSARCRASSPR